MDRIRWASWITVGIGAAVHIILSIPTELHACHLQYGMYTGRVRGSSVEPIQIAQYSAPLHTDSGSALGRAHDLWAGSGAHGDILTHHRAHGNALTSQVHCHGFRVHTNLSK